MAGKQSDPKALDGKRASSRNRRKHTRFPATVGFVDLQLRATLVDESYAGMGVILPPGWSISVDTTVIIDYFGTPTEAIVCHEESLPDGGVRLGLRWAND